jgi:hypothetical protein
MFFHMFSIVHIPQALPHRIVGSRLSCGTSAQTTQRSSTKLAMSRQALGRDLPGTRRNPGPRTAETGNSKPEIQNWNWNYEISIVNGFYKRIYTQNWNWNYETPQMGL